MRSTAVAGSLLVALLAADVAAAGCLWTPVREQPAPFRRMPPLSLEVFACAPNPAYHVFSSRAELMKVLDALAPHCPESAYQERRTNFLRDLERVAVDWDNEAVVILEEYYGTGMAKARLELAAPAPHTVRASIVWEVPPPPVTPDTVVFRFVFAVDTSTVTRLVVEGRRGATTLAVAPERRD